MAAKKVRTKTVAQMRKLAGYYKRHHKKQK